MLGDVVLRVLAKAIGGNGRSSQLESNPRTSESCVSKVAKALAMRSTWIYYISLYYIKYIVYKKHITHYRIFKNRQLIRDNNSRVSLSI